MPASIRHACALGAIVLASLLSGPAGAGKPVLVLALDDSNPRHCRQVPDGSQICDELPSGGGNSLGGADPNSPYMACKMGCNEHANTLLQSKREAYLEKCLQECQRRYSQRTKGG
jgi:hypothetical protein